MIRGKILKIYLDTSVIGGCIDPEFAPWSNGLIQDFREGNFKPVISEIVTSELKSAPAAVKQAYADIQAIGVEALEVTDEARMLADMYQERGILTPKFYDDGLHISIATVAEVDVLTSWNFRHIVRLNKIRMFNAVNIEFGYKAITIYSPREITNYEIGND